MRILSTLLFGLACVGLVVSDCCSTNCGCISDGNDWFCPDCYDGNRGTPCCGKGTCNIFCCNCDDGCRGNGHCVSDDADMVAHRSPAQKPLASRPLSYSYDSLFDQVNTASPDGMTLAEYLVWVNAREPAASNNATIADIWIEYFHCFDANGDGKIQFNEMHRATDSEGLQDL